MQRADSANSAINPPGSIRAQPAQPRPGSEVAHQPAGPPAEPIPEPLTMFLLGSGLAGVAIVHRRRRRARDRCPVGA